MHLEQTPGYRDMYRALAAAGFRLIAHAGGSTAEVNRYVTAADGTRRLAFHRVITQVSQGLAIAAEHSECCDRCLGTHEAVVGSRLLHDAIYPGGPTEVDVELVMGPCSCAGTYVARGWDALVVGGA